MCAIFGLIGAHDHPHYQGDIMQHRGPDGGGLWKSPASEFPIMFSHDRLAVVSSRNDNNQPLVSHNSRFVLNFNGEIFNFLDLKHSLSKQGAVFNSSCDTEILLNGLVIHGFEFLASCNGMWAFCLWDRERQEGYLVRDRFGEKPLYFSIIPTPQCRRTLAYASEIKALVPLLPQKSPHPYLDVLLKYPFNYESTQHTFLKDVLRVPPGSIVAFKNGEVTTNRWWNTCEHLREITEPYSDQVSLFKETLIDSVRVRSEVNTSYAITCSGGLDSSSVLSIFSQLPNTPVGSAYTVSYPGTPLDEAQWARMLCENLSFPLIEQCVQTPTLDAVIQSLRQLEDPYLIFSTPMFDLYKKMSQDGRYVCLDGHGADELCGGYFNLLQGLGPLDFPSYLNYYNLSQSLRNLPELSHSLFAWGKWGKYLLTEGAIPQLKPLYYKAKSLFSKDEVEFATFLKEAPYHKHPHYLKMDPLSKKLFDLYHHTTLPTLLRNYDRYSMSSGVEVRSPFLDYRLVTLSFSLPIQSKIGYGYTKRILRDSMRGIVPDPLLKRRDKMSWLSPTRSWMLGPLNQDLINYFTLRQNLYALRLLKKLKKVDVTYPLIVELWRSSVL